MAPDGDTSPGVESPVALSTAELMRGVRERALGSSRASGEELAMSATLREARELLESDRLLASKLLGDRSEWDLQTFLRFNTHRPLLGRFLIALKRYLLLPPLRWLYEYSAVNFVRQREINRALLAYVEVLARENARLRADLESRTGATTAESPPETPVS